MTTIELLQVTIDYIEENLKSELTLSELSEKAGFSLYYYSHIFCDVVGMPVNAFITKRRLYHALYEIQNGSKLIDAALSYCFDTHAGFFKAFRREFGCSPTKYLTLNTAHKPKAVNLIKEARVMLTQTQIRQLLTNWEIDNKSGIDTTMILGGAEVSPVTWTVDERYIFKTGTNISGLKTHIDISRALERSGMVASCPILTKSGEDFVIVEDRYYILTNRIKGDILTTEQRYTGDRFLTGKKYGEAIGNLHTILKKQDHNLEVNDSSLLDTVLHWALPETKRIMEQWNCPLPEEFYQSYIEVFSKLYPNLPCHLIHRDPNPSNIIFHQGEVAGFIDFEISERNIRLFDPCYCATGILSEADMVDEGLDKWSELLKGILSGYDSICNLTEDEKQSIPFVIYSIQMIFIAYLDGKESLKNIALQNRKMLVWIWENRTKLFEKY